MPDFEEDFEKVQRREGDRQRLIEELKKMILDVEEGCMPRGDDMDAIEKARGAFHTTLMLCFKLYLGGLTLDFGLEVTGLPKESLRNLVVEKILMKITGFTVVPEERFCIIAELFTFSAMEVIRPFERKFGEKCVLPPGRKEFLKKIGFTD